jgi:hypothetical protein
MLPASEAANMDLGHIMHQLETMTNGHVISSEDNASDADSETLEVAEEEARWRPINRHHVNIFDRLPDGLRKRRYISAWPDEDMVGTLADDKFVDLFRNHVKRKRFRRKIRTHPEVMFTQNSIQFFIFYMLFCIQFSA